MSRLRGPTVRHRQPILAHYGRDLTALEALGSTSGEISEYGATTLASTKATIVWNLPNPKPGMIKRVAVSYEGETADLVIATKTTTQFFGGSSNNNITVSSSQDRIAIEFYGLSTNEWGLIFSGDRGGGSTSIIYVDSTISTTTDADGI